MFAQPITDKKGNAVGVITTSFFNPNPSLIEQTDKKLSAAAQGIAQNVTVKNGRPDIRRVDSRLVPIDVSYQIVDQYNTILRKSRNVNRVDRTPHFIDPSYIRDELEHLSTRQVHSKNTGNPFLVQSKPLVDQAGDIYGLVVAGTAINQLYAVLMPYIIISGIAALVCLLLCLVVLRQYGAQRARSTQAPVEKPYTLQDIQRVRFVAKDGTITVNDRTIKLTYATNQYYMCKALFSAPKKRWENDELMEAFGEALDANSWRKAYDAHAAINKKVQPVMSLDLIVVSNKTYQINPLLLSKLS